MNAQKELLKIKEEIDIECAVIQASFIALQHKMNDVFDHGLNAIREFQKMKLANNDFKK